MTVGLCTIIAARTMEVVTYVFSTYELALAQAIENQKGVKAKIKREAEERHANGLRQTVFKVAAFMEIVIVAEVSVGDAVLPVQS